MKTSQNTQRLNFETFFRSNQDTCLSQRPLVKQGQWIGKGQLLADCINSVSGDLALGKNVLVAYMPWEGYNFEDSIVISDRLIAEDIYTSIHILRFRTEIVDNLGTKSSNVNYKFSLSSKTKTLGSTLSKIPTIITPLLFHNYSVIIKTGHLFRWNSSLRQRRKSKDFLTSLFLRRFAYLVPPRGNSKDDDSLPLSVLASLSEGEGRRLWKSTWGKTEGEESAQSIPSALPMNILFSSGDVMHSNAQRGSLSATQSKDHVRRNEESDQMHRRAQLRSIKSSFTNSKLKTTFTLSPAISGESLFPLLDPFHVNLYAPLAFQNGVYIFDTRILTKILSPIALNRKYQVEDITPLSHLKLTEKPQQELKNETVVFGETSEAFDHGWQNQKADNHLTFSPSVSDFQKNPNKSYGITEGSMFPFLAYGTPGNTLPLPRTSPQEYPILPSVTKGNAPSSLPRRNTTDSEAKTYGVKKKMFRGIAKLRPSVFGGDRSTSEGVNRGTENARRRILNSLSSFSSEVKVQEGVPVLPSVITTEKRTPKVPFLGDHLLAHLDDNGVAKVGTWVSPGDILVGKVRPLANKLKSSRASTQLAWEIISSKKNEFMNMEDRSFRLPKGVYGRVIKNEIISHSSGEHIHVYLAIKRKIQIGDKLAGRHGNKGIVSLVLPRQDMPYLADGTPIDIILSPLGVPSRMNVGQIYECLLGLAAKSLECDFKINNSMVSSSLPKAKKTNYSGMMRCLCTQRRCKASGTPRVFVNITKGNTCPYTLLPPVISLARTRCLNTLGCTTNARLAPSVHQVQAILILPKVIKKVIKYIDTPYPFGVSRTNKSEKGNQMPIFRVGKDTNSSSIQRYVGYKQNPISILKDKLQINHLQPFLFLAKVPFSNASAIAKHPHRFNGETKFYVAKAKYKYRMQTQELIFAKSKTKQVSFSPNLEARNLVFLKLYHSRIISKSKWLFSPSYPGKMRLFDGRTGQPFASWITVGYAYMLKLIHLVDNKMHSRSTGPYSLITRQPVTGKARQGGQRIGEMEAWALEGFGAAYTLQEFFSFKGDDVSSRHQWQITTMSKMVGNTTAFKTLLSELRALCISIDFTGYSKVLT